MVLPRRPRPRHPAPVRRLREHPPLELGHGDRSPPPPVPLPGRHQAGRLPDGAAAHGDGDAPRAPLHRRRHRPRQDHRGGPHRPRAPAPQEGADHRGRRARLGPRTVAGGDGGALRPPLRDPRPPLLRPDAPRPGLRREPVADPQPLPRLPQPAGERHLRSADARVARRPPPRQPADPRRGAPRRAVERRALRHRIEAHQGGPRDRGRLRAPPLPLRHPAQRPLQQLLHPHGVARPLPLHPRREGHGPAGAGGAPGRHGPPPQGGHPGNAGRLPEADRGTGGGGRPARGRPGTRALEAPRRIPRAP